MNKLSSKLISAIAMLYMTTAGAAVVEYDFVAEAAGNEGGYSSYMSDGDSAGATVVTVTGGNVAGTTSYYAYLDDLDVDNRPGGMGVCQVLEAGEGSECLDSADDNLGDGVPGGEMLTLSWGQVVTINEIVFRNFVHRTDFAADQDFQIRIDGGAWAEYSLTHIFTTSLVGSTFDFITDDTFGFNGCTSALCADLSDTQLYISSLVIQTPEPGMVVLFLVGVGLVAFSTRRRTQTQV